MIEKGLSTRAGVSFSDVLLTLGGGREWANTREDLRPLRFPAENERQNTLPESVTIVLSDGAMFIAL